MARPRITQERSAQILDAVEVCVARYGLEGASLQRIAEEAGLARGLLRHHVGNRDALIEAMAERFLVKSTADMAALRAALPAKGRVEAMIEMLFDPSYASTAHEIRVAEALVGAGHGHPGLKALLQRWLTGTEQAVFEELQCAYPTRSEAILRSVATGLLGMVFSADSMDRLGAKGALFERSREAALRLVGTL